MYFNDIILTQAPVNAYFSYSSSLFVCFHPECPQSPLAATQEILPTDNDINRGYQL